MKVSVMPQPPLHRYDKLSYAWWLPKGNTEAMPAISRPMSHRPPQRVAGDAGKPVIRDIPYDYRRHVGEWMRDLRLSANLRQQDVAEALGLGFTAISAIEVGRTSVPPEKYEAFAELFGVDPVEFGRVMIRYTNPWAYSMVFGKDTTLAEDIGSISARRPTSTGPRF